MRLLGISEIAQMLREIQENEENQERYLASHFFPAEKKPPVDVFLPPLFVLCPHGVMEIVSVFEKRDGGEIITYNLRSICLTPFFVSALVGKYMEIYVYDKGAWFRSHIDVAKILQASAYLKNYIFPVNVKAVMQYVMHMAAEAPRINNSEFEEKIKQVWEKLAELYDFTTLPVRVPISKIRDICENLGVRYNDFKNEMAKIGVIETDERPRWDRVEKKTVRYVMFFSCPILSSNG